MLPHRGPGHRHGLEKPAHIASTSLSPEPLAPIAPYLLVEPASHSSSAGFWEMGMWIGNIQSEFPAPPWYERRVSVRLVGRHVALASKGCCQKSLICPAFRSRVSHGVRASYILNSKCASTIVFVFCVCRSETN